VQLSLDGEVSLGVNSRFAFLFSFLFFYKELGGLPLLCLLTRFLIFIVSFFFSLISPPPRVSLQRIPLVAEGAVVDERARLKHYYARLLQSRGSEW
jgi:hypothetical protein